VVVVVSVVIVIVVVVVVVGRDPWSAPRDYPPHRIAAPKPLSMFTT